MIGGFPETLGPLMGEGRGLPTDVEEERQYRIPSGTGSTLTAV